MSQLIAEQIGADLSTTGLAVTVRGSNKIETVVIAMQGACRWHGGAAHDVNYTPFLLLSALVQLQSKGWDFSEPGTLCFSVRQHDMIIANQEYDVLIPALSWECNKAQVMAEVLNANTDVTDAVGHIEARFILAKLLWALQQDSSLADKDIVVMTTGDWIVGKLTGQWCLSTSDGLSNGLLLQDSKKLATDVLAMLQIPSRIPEVIKSGTPVGRVLMEEDASSAWYAVKIILAAWEVLASLGDNHAGAVGAGLCDENTIVASFGSSGTAVRMCDPGASLAGTCSRFEYFDHRLLLAMLARCARWYDDFRNRFVQTAHVNDHDYLNNSAMQASWERCLYVAPGQGVETEDYSQSFRNLGQLGNKIASVQLSIAAEMFKRICLVAEEVTGDPKPVKRCCLVGGLSRAPLIRDALVTWLKPLGIAVEVSDQKTSSSAQAAAYGAMSTAYWFVSGLNLVAVTKELCPTSSWPEPASDQAVKLTAWFKSNEEKIMGEVV